MQLELVACEVVVVKFSFTVLSAVLVLSSVGVGPLAQPEPDIETDPDSVIQDITGLYQEESAAQPVYPMSEERREKLYSYANFVNIWRFVSFGVGIAVLALILFTGLSARLRTWAQKIPLKFFALWVFVILFLLVDYALNLPFSIYRGYVVESSYGFLNQTFLEWWGEDLLGLGISLVLAIIPVWFLYWLINRTRAWWVWFSVGAIPMAVLLIVIAPVFISPLFNDFTPLEDKQLEERILSLADRAGIEGSDVFQVNASKQSSKINAYVTGLFGTKRIVLYDTLIKNFTSAEIEFVMGHEMGHYVMDHLWWGLGLAILLILFSLWFTNKTIHAVIRRFRHRFEFERLGDRASLPLILIYASVLSFFLQPVENGASRYMEHQSDVYGMEITNVSGEEAATAFDKLSVFNLSDPDPHPLIEFWFYSHPSLASRMDFVRAYRP